jgi:hypothetical protein
MIKNVDWKHLNDYFNLKKNVKSKNVRVDMSIESLYFCEIQHNIKDTIWFIYKKKTHYDFFVWFVFGLIVLIIKFKILCIFFKSLPLNQT